MKHTIEINVPSEWELHEEQSDIIHIVEPEYGEIHVTIRKKQKKTFNLWL